MDIYNVERSGVVVCSGRICEYDLINVPVLIYGHNLKGLMRSPAVFVTAAAATMPSHPNGDSFKLQLEIPLNHKLVELWTFFRG